MSDSSYWAPGAPGAKLAESGWPAIPISPPGTLSGERGGKAPGRYTNRGWLPLAGWQHGAVPTADEVTRYAQLPGRPGVGIVCGKPGTLVAGVDVDVRHGGAADAIRALAEQLLGSAPVRIGAAPKFLLVYRLAAPITKAVTPEYVLPGDVPGEKRHHVEVLADGQQFVAYGIHPVTRQPYAWPGDELAELRPDMLTVITREALDEFLNAAAKVLEDHGGKAQGSERKPGASTQRPRTPPEERRAVDHAELLEAFSTIRNAELPYDQWVAWGYRLKGAMGPGATPETEEAYYDAWMRWSASTAKGEDGASEAEGVWKRIDPELVEAAGAQQIYREARARGWEPRAPESADAAEKLQQALALVRALPEKAKVDRGAPYEPKTIEALAFVSSNAAPDYERLRPLLKESGVSITRLDAAVKQQAKHLPKRNLRIVEPGEQSVEPQPGTAAEQLGDAACPDVPGDLVVPCGYKLTPTVTFALRLADDGSTQDVPVAPSPILVGGQLVDVDDGHVHLSLQYRDRGGWTGLLVPREEALDNRRATGLAGSGFPISSRNASAVVGYVFDFEAANQARLPRAEVTHHLGWQGDGGNRGFLLGRQLVLPDGTITEASDVKATSPRTWGSAGLAFHGLAPGDNQRAGAFSAAGSLEGWVRVIEKLRDYPIPLALLYAAFAAPLLMILGVANFIIEAACSTSMGKTTALRCAASVHGCPDEHQPYSALNTWDMTAVAIERTAVMQSDLPLLLDDTKRAKHAREVARAIYLIASGRGRGRGNKRSLDVTRTFRTVGMSSGESPATYFTEDGGTRTRTAEMRDPPFGLPNERTRQIVDELNIGVMENYGHAGPLYVAWLLKNRGRWDQFRDAFRKARESLLTTFRGPEAGRIAGYAATIELAGALAHAALDLPWKFRDPIDQLWARLAAEAEDAAGAGRALRDVMGWIYANESRFDGRYSGSDSTEPPGGWMGRWSQGEEWDFVGVFPHLIRRFLTERGYTPDEIFNAWRQKGWIEVDQGFTRKSQRVDGKCVHLVVIRREAFQEANGESPSR